MTPAQFQKKSVRYRAMNSFDPTAMLITDENRHLIIEKICSQAVNNMLRKYSIEKIQREAVDGPAATGE